MCRVYKSGMRTWLFTFPILTLFLGFSTDANAHPHAWISVKTVIVLNDKNEAVAIREHWLFDKMYSAYASRDFNPNKNGTFTAKDLLPLAQENITNLKDYNYFTVIEDGNGKTVALKTAKDIASDFEDAPPSSKKKVIVYAVPKGQPTDEGIGKQIAMDFTVPLAMPVDLHTKTATYRIYDPTYYTDMNHYEQKPVTFVSEKDGAEIKGCQAKVELPKIDQSMLFSASALDKNATAPKDLGYYFSEKVTISCLPQKP